MTDFTTHKLGAAVFQLQVSFMNPIPKLQELMNAK